MRSYFEALSFQCPLHSNPADFYVDISSVDHRSMESERVSAQRVKLLANAYKANKATVSTTSTTSPPDVSLSAASRGEGPRAVGVPYVCPWTRQVWLLTTRFLVNNLRSGANIAGGILQAVLMGVVIMLIFFHLTDSLEDIESRNGLIYLSVSMECYILMIILVERYCTDLKVFDRELQDNMYSSSAYLIAHIVSSAPILIIQPVIFSIPIYFGCNLRPGAMHFSVFIAVQVAMSFVTNGLAWASVSLSRNFTVASLIANTNFTFITIASGFLVVTSDIPIYLRWVKHISYIQYAYRILMSNEFSDRVFAGCPYPIESDCSQYNGNDILSTQSVRVNEYKSLTWLYIFAIWVAYYGVAFLCLHFIRFPVTGVVGGDNELGDENWVDGGADTLSDSLGTMPSNTPTAAVGSVSTSDPDPESLQVLAYQEGTPVSISVKAVSLFVPVHQSRWSLLSTPSRPNGATDATTPLLSSHTQHLQSHSYDVDKKRILHEVSAEIRPGRLVALMGGSGSG